MGAEKREVNPGLEDSVSSSSGIVESESRSKPSEYMELFAALVGDLSLGESTRGVTPSSFPGEQLDKISSMVLGSSCLDFFLAILSSSTGCDMYPLSRELQSSSSKTVNMGRLTDRERPRGAILAGLTFTPLLGLGKNCFESKGLFLGLSPSGLSANL